MENRKILLVDDDAHTLEVLTEQLQTEYEISAALSGHQALQLAKDEGPFAVIICDMQMPEMDGVEVLELMQKISPDTTRVMLTGLADQKIAINAINEGHVFRFFSKPCSKKILLCGVKSAMNQYKLVTDARELLGKTKIIAAQKEQLETLNHEKNTFFSIIAHDLKSPFGALLGFTKLLDMTVDTLPRKEIKTHSANIHISATHVFKLLENLLEWSLLQMDGIDYNPVEIELSEIIVNTENVLGPSAAEKAIDIKIEMNISTAYADQHMLDAVIRNLVNNAIKFTPKGGRITIKTSAENGSVTISVHDTGIGISERTLGQLFKLSKSVTAKGTEGETGTGLGLILCKELVERNKGRIWVESEIDQGSTFSFTLPLVNNPGLRN